MNLFFLQLRNELKKLFARKRTYIGFGAFLLVELFILFQLNRPRPRASFQRFIEENGYGFDQYFSGLTLGLAMLTWTSFLLGSLYLALIAGDVMSKEIEEGTMRMMLCRPISRARIVALKYAACVIYTFVLVAFIGISALLTGLFYKGFGGLILLPFIEQFFAIHEPWPGLMRYLGALPLLALSMTTITSMGFMFSCFNMKPAAATIVTLSLFFFDTIFHNIPYFESLKPYFLTTHMSAWMHVFKALIPTWEMLEDYAYLFGLDATFLIIGLAVFHQRDFKS
jgi:ABC-2 type transport system permease protein